MHFLMSLAVIAGFFLLTPASVSNAKIPDSIYAPRPEIKRPPRWRVLEAHRDFTFTAYYSPEKGQPRYSYKRKGVSRTYAEEIKLQGEGKETKLGTKPRLGTVAANLGKLKPFSRIRIRQKIDGEYRTIFIGRVEDTGEAMQKNPKQVDLYMGRNMQGLLRAERFGTKTGHKDKLIIEVIERVS